MLRKVSTSMAGRMAYIIKKREKIKLNCMHTIAWYDVEVDEGCSFLLENIFKQVFSLLYEWGVFSCTEMSGNVSIIFLLVLSLV